MLASLYLGWFQLPSGGTLNFWDAETTRDSLVAAAGLLLILASLGPFRSGTRVIVGGGLTAAMLVLLAASAIHAPDGLSLNLLGPVVAVLGLALQTVGFVVVRSESNRAVDNAKGIADVDQAGELRSARIESMRAIAALCVFAVHAYLGTQNPTSGVVDRVLLGGAFGVFFFFVLSGYLLFKPFARSIVDGDVRPALGSYALNRGLRIIPLYFAVVLVLLVFEVNGGRVEFLPRFLLFLENYSADTVLRADSPMWSLAVEVHFYIVLPIVAMIIGAIARGSVVKCGLAVALIAVAALALRFSNVTLQEVPDFRWSYSLLTLFQFFAAGMLLSLVSLRWDKSWTKRLPRILQRSDLWFLASLPFWALAFSDRRFEIAAAPASVLVIAGGVLPLIPGIGVRILEWRGLALTGLISYSIYLLHVPLLSLVADAPISFDAAGFASTTGRPHEMLWLVVAGLPVVLVVSALTYRFIEAPFLRLRLRWQRT